MAARLPSCNDWHNEDPGRQKRRGNPEYRQLDVPGAHNVKRQDRRNIDAEKSFRFGAIMRNEASGEGLQEEQQRRDEQKPDDGSLGRRHGHLIDRTKLDRCGCRVAPAEPVVAAEAIQDEPGPSQQADDGNHAPGHGVGGHDITRQRFRRPIIGVGVGIPRTIGRRGPRGPGEERGEPVHIIRARHPLSLGAAARVLRIKPGAVVFHHPAVRLPSGRAPDQRTFRRVVGVFVKFDGDALAR